MFYQAAALFGRLHGLVARLEAQAMGGSSLYRSHPDDRVGIMRIWHARLGPDGDQPGTQKAQVAASRSGSRIEPGTVYPESQKVKKTAYGTGRTWIALLAGTKPRGGAADLVEPHERIQRGSSVVRRGSRPRACFFGDTRQGFRDLAVGAFQDWLCF